MFFHRDDLGWAEIGFTDASTDLGRTDDPEHVATRRRVAETLRGGEATERLEVASMHQVHGADVVSVRRESPGASSPAPTADALVTGDADVALVVRVADCTPIVLVGEVDRRAAVVHAGREGLVRGVVPAAVQALGLGERPSQLHAWVGPRACGRCYELPEEMADAVEAAVPGTRSTTSWGTPAVDVGAGVVSQLRTLGVTVHDIGRDVCTIEDDRFWSHRRQGEAAGRMGAVVVLRHWTKERQP
ncbi:polyphenol oxidase family protein [Aeromicrobium sp. 50.2.37]|uniref:polyphenol oxidase family protein n=1 Tax=Aeromicrobium sp. 50.2.37 TaxID=2969305 RepID=UPI0021503715|nr:polyphenol oxidase family protein [Aeromicrobium sp. 50.2.37]MCR4512255.1 polyphenol oxidase family protein [Aeromicrobium sp. 50.2.37]